MRSRPATTRSGWSNSLLTTQRKPAIVEGFHEFTDAVMNGADEVDPGLKRLAAHFASHGAGCQYCEAHSLVAANLNGVSQEKLDALPEYESSDLHSERERVALDFALAAISLYGFLNRWNDTLAADLVAVCHRWVHRPWRRGPGN